MLDCFGFGFGCLHILLLLGALFVGSWGGFGSLGDMSLRRSDQDTFSSVLQENQNILQYSNMTTNVIRRRRSSDSAHLKILGSSHLSALKDLLSERKLTVRLGLRIAVRDTNELLEPQLQLFLNKEPGLYNAGNKAGLFSMRVLEIKKVSNSKKPL